MFGFYGVELPHQWAHQVGVYFPHKVNSAEVSGQAGFIATRCHQHPWPLVPAPPPPPAPTSLRFCAHACLRVECWLLDLQPLICILDGKEKEEKGKGCRGRTCLETLHCVSLTGTTLRCHPLAVILAGRVSVVMGPDASLNQIVVLLVRKEGDRTSNRQLAL